MVTGHRAAAEAPRDWPDWAVRLRHELPALLSRADAAELLDVSENTIDRRRRMGDLESVVLGGRVLIPAEAVVTALVAGRERRAS